MKKNDRTDESTRREKENMDEPQEEFISDDPPSRSQPEAPEEPSHSSDEPQRDH